jgi:hypothetical protein
MNHLTHRTLLRISSFLAVMVGLATASTVLASPPAVSEVAQAEPTEQQAEPRDQQADPEGETYQQETYEQDEQVDLPRDIENFAEFVEEHQNEGIEDIYDYTDKGANHLADSLKELLPDEADEHEEAIDTWEDRLGVLGNEDRPQYPALARQLLMEGAELLTNIQEAYYPGMDEQASQVKEAAEEISQDTTMTEQAREVEQFFVASSRAVVNMAGQTPQPVALHTLDLMPVVFPTELAQQREDPAVEEWEDPAVDDDRIYDEWGMDDRDVPRQVNNFTDFVQDHQTEGIDHVANYTRDGVVHFHDAMEGLLDEAGATLLEQIEDVFTEDERSREAANHDNLELQLQRYELSARALQDTGRAAFPSTLVNTLTEGTEVLTSIQQTYYPGQEGQLRQLEANLREIDTTVAIEEQVEVIQNFFIQAAATTEAMALAGPIMHERPEVRRDEEADIVLVDDGGEETPQGQEDEIGGGPTLSQEVQRYQTFTQTLVAERLSEEQVVDGMRHMEAAINSLAQEEPVVLRPVQMEEEPWVQPDDEPGMDQPGMGEPADGKQELQEQLSQHIDELSRSIGEEEFGQHLKMSMESAVQLLETMQGEEFLALEDQVRQLRGTVDQIEADVSLEDQSDAIIQAFNNSSSVLADMDRMRQEEGEIRRLEL